MRLYERPQLMIWNTEKIAAEKLARQYEAEHKWAEAAAQWEKFGLARILDVQACKLIDKAVRKGNAYRADVERIIGPEPELTPTTIRQWEKWHQDLREIYNNHFKNKHDETNKK